MSIGRCAAVAGFAALLLAACSSSSSGKAKPPPQPKVANVTMSIDQSLVDYSKAHGIAAFKAKAKEACTQQHVDSVELTVAPSIGGPSATFSYDCSKL